jgi:hypothetical protein
MVEENLEDINAKPQEKLKAEDIKKLEDIKYLI